MGSVSRFIDQCGVCRALLFREIFFFLPLSLERYVRPDVCHGYTALAPSSRAERRRPSRLAAFRVPRRFVRVHTGRAPGERGPSGSQDRKMRLRIRWILLVSTAVVIIAGCDAATEKEQSDSKQRTSASSTYNTFPDDLYLDDQDALEGSGRGGGDNRDDLEASGSGLGPDDEDGDDDHEFTGNNGLEVPSKPTEARPPPYIIDETNVKTKQTTIDTVNRPGNEANVIEPSGTEDDHADNTDDIHEVYIMNPKPGDRTSSFFAQPGVLAAVIGGAVVGLLCAILVVMFIVYRMRKKDEGSYALDEPRRSPAAQAFPKPGAPHHNREFYA